MHRTAARALTAVAIALAAALATAPAAAQSTQGITIVTADWLDGWGPDGGWVALPSGQGLGKAPTVIHDPSAALPPGTYNIYWVQDAEIAPLLLEANVTVNAGAMTEVRAATGATLELADWVPPPVAGHAWFGAIVSTSTSSDFVNRTRTGTSIFLPPGEYDFLYENDDTDDIPPIWVGTQTIEPVFAGVGLEVMGDDNGILVVRAIPGGPAEAAGLQADDVITAVDGQSIAGMELADAVALLRGPSESSVTIAVLRDGQTRDVTLVRGTVEPQRIIRANGGIQLAPPMDGVDPIGPGGWWGVVFAGDAPDPGNYRNWEVGHSTAPLLLGPAPYDVYWNPTGEGEPALIAENVAVSGELVTVTPEPQPMPEPAPPAPAK
jgi:membrane-associated protease RseP (regulator of RpoE activity)